MAQALSAMSQAIGELSPLIMQGVLPFETAQALLLSIIRRYQLGDDVEEAIKQMQPPPQEPQDNTMQVEQLKAQIEQLRLDYEQKLKGAELQHDMDVENAKNATEMQINRETLEAQNQIEQGKASTDMTIEQMRIEAERQYMLFSETMNRLNTIEAQNEPTEF